MSAARSTNPRIAFPARSTSGPRRSVFFRSIGKRRRVCSLISHHSPLAKTSPAIPTSKSSLSIWTLWIIFGGCQLNIARVATTRAKRCLHSDKLATTQIIQLPHLAHRRAGGRGQRGEAAGAAAQFAIFENPLALGHSFFTYFGSIV